MRFLERVMVCTLLGVAVGCTGAVDEHIATSARLDALGRPSGTFACPGDAEVRVRRRGGLREFARFRWIERCCTSPSGAFSPCKEGPVELWYSSGSYPYRWGEVQGGEKVGVWASRLPDGSLIQARYEPPGTLQETVVIDSAGTEQCRTEEADWRTACGL